jgi:hypothetical protein
MSASTLAVAFGLPADFGEVTQPASSEQYKVLWANLAARLPGVDPGAKDPTRLNYLPRVPRGASGHEFIVRDDRPWLAEMAAIPAPAPSQLGGAFLPPRAGIAADNDVLIIQRQPVTKAELLRTLADYAEYDQSKYGSWLEVGAIIHHETGGSNVGLKMFIAYSRCLSGFYDGAEAGEEECIRKWASFGRSGAKPVTFGTLIHKLTTLRATRGPEKRDDLEGPERSIPEQVRAEVYADLVPALHALQSRPLRTRTAATLVKVQTATLQLRNSGAVARLGRVMWNGLK